MSFSPSKPSAISKQRNTGEARGKKLKTLPKNATVSKRGLARPPIPSPYSGPSSQKVVYIGSKTPFMSAVKRVEKLLKLSEKRLVQSATQIAQNSNSRKRKRDDEITAIAEEVEHLKKSNAEGPEEVAIKGTGKAIAKVMEMGVWFQEREEEYQVRLVTSSVSSIDDVSWEEKGEGDEAAEEMEETRVRKVSVLEVFVSLR